MSSNCTCPDDWRAVPKDSRVEVIEPGAVYFEGGKKIIDRSKMHVFDKKCPVHGYEEIT